MQKNNRNTFTQGSQFIRNLLGFLFLLVLLTFLSLVVLANIPKSLKQRILSYNEKGIVPQIQIPFNPIVKGGYTYKKYEEYQKIENLEILFMGSSHCLQTFDPRFFAQHGTSAFNWGTTGQSFINTYYLLKWLSIRHKPKMVILETYPRIFDTDGKESALDLMPNLPFGWYQLRMILATKNPRVIMALLIELFEFKSEERHNPAEVTEDSKKYYPGGYVEVDIKNDREVPLQTWESQINPSQVRYFEKILKWCHRNDITIISVIVPIPQITLQHWNDYCETAIMIEKICSEQGVEFIDFNRLEIITEDRYFYDYHHLNADGARKFLPIFWGNLISRGVVCDN